MLNSETVELEVGMKNYFLVIFGLVGLSVSLLQGLGAFLDFSQLVSWFLSTWSKLILDATHFWPRALGFLYRKLSRKP